MMPPVLRSISLPVLPHAGFPFSVPALRTVGELDVDTPVTFLVGENGTGKSTLLEGIAVAARVPALGSHETAHDPTLRAARELAAALRLTWRRRSARGFFLRAEDFFGYLRRESRVDARLSREAAELAGDRGGPEDSGAEHPDELGSGAHLAWRDSRSHGESFLDVFRTRLRGDALYLLDEPETPLSPQRQLALLCLLMDAASEGAQFIVATHSPILLALPGARIYSLDHTPVRRVEYASLEHVTLTRDFLNDPERFLRHLRG